MSLLLAGLVGSAMLGGMSSAMNITSNNNNINKSIVAQRKENQLNREWNLNLAKQANQWNLEQWNRENAYNTPLAQKRRMIEAGLNPDLAYANGGAFTPAATSPEMTAGASSRPMDMSMIAQKKSYGQVFADAFSIAQGAVSMSKERSEAGKNNQETKNLAVENQILSADALTRAAQNEATLEYTRANIHVAHNTAELTHTQKEYYAEKINEVAANTDRMYAERDKFVAQTSEIDMNILQAKFDMYIRSKEFELACKKVAQEIKESDSRIKMNEQEVKSSIAITAARVLNLNVNSRLQIQQRLNAVKEGIGIDIGIERASFNFDQDKKWDDKQRRADVCSKWMTGIGIAIGGFSTALKNASGPVSIKGFR